jgi:hypothetical protein
VDETQAFAGLAIRRRGLLLRRSRPSHLTAARSKRGLLLTAELAYRSLDERVRQRVQADVATPRLLAILTVTVAAIPASALVLIAADADVARSPASTAAGATAIVACIALLAALAHFRSGVSTPP